MKKVRAMLLCAFMLLGVFSVPAQAKVGDVIGEALNTDIVAYINGAPLPSYAVNGQSAVVAEDLRNFGFDVVWNGESRSLTITRNASYQFGLLNANKDGIIPGTKYADILETDIRVYAGGKQITSYALNGYTMIPMEELTIFGAVHWVPAERAIKLQIEDTYYYGTTVPDYAYVTGIPLKGTYKKDGSIIYYYEDTEYGEWSEMVDYMAYLKENGWAEVSTNQTETSLMYNFKKDGILATVCYEPDFDEVWIIVDE